METAMRSALPGDEFRLVFQPLLNLKDNRICAFEALLRWNHPQRGYLRPAQFIPIAEESGLIVPIGEWVLREACAAAAGWPGDVGVAVNLSPVQFRKNRNLVEHVKAALCRAPAFGPTGWKLEITESVLLADNENALLVLQQLKDARRQDRDGRFRHRLFVAQLSRGASRSTRSRSTDPSSATPRSSADSLAIVKAVIGLGHSLGLATTAEGVETEDQLRHDPRARLHRGAGISVQPAIAGQRPSANCFPGSAAPAPATQCGSERRSLSGQRLLKLAAVLRSACRRAQGG